jgi:uncharacterized membrane protein YdjX (TVP38/TMEM64 family)
MQESPAGPARDDPGPDGGHPGLIARARSNPRILASVALSAAWFTMPALFSIGLFAYLGPVSEWLRSHGGAGVAVAALGFAATAGLGLMPTYAQAVLMGWVFGTATGVGTSVAGYLGGAVLGWGVCRAVARDEVRMLIDAQPRWRVVRTALVDASPARTVGLVALLRFPPTSPFAFTNMLLAATGVRFWPMIAGSLVGMLPRTALAAWFGAQGAATGAQDLRELMQRQGPVAVVVGVALIVAVLAVMQHVGKRALRAAGLS